MEYEGPARVMVVWIDCPYRVRNSQHISSKLGMTWDVERAKLYPYISPNKMNRFSFLSHFSLKVVWNFLKQNENT